MFLKSAVNGKRRGAAPLWVTGILLAIGFAWLGKTWCDMVSYNEVQAFLKGDTDVLHGYDIGAPEQS